MAIIKAEIINADHDRLYLQRLGEKLNRKE
jgi:hypothetical protein